jgi:CO/xanthine dehydrogenase Mo-binding subunit
MTGLLNEQAFTRKSFLRGGGALLVGFSVGAGLLAGEASARVSGLSGVNAGPPDPSQVDTWVAVHSDNTATIYPGLQELGNGSSTGLLQIAGEELSMDVSQLQYGVSDSNRTPNNVAQSASNAIKSGGPKLRAASALAAQALLGMASSSLGVPVSQLSVKSGVVSGGGKSVAYGALIGGKLFNVQAPASYSLAPTTANPPAIGVGVPTGFPGTKPVSQYTLVGTRVPRIEIPAKVAGTYTYIHNVRVPGMLHGRVVRPRGQGAFGDPLSASVDASSVSHIPEVQVVQVGSFVGVVAAREYDAIQAAAQLRVSWTRPSNLPGDANLYQHMDTTPTTRDFVVTQAGDVGQGFAQAARIISQTYHGAYQTHAVIGPSCSVADVQPASATVFVNSQNVYTTRSKIASILNVPASQVRVRFFEGSSCFGQSPYDDAAQAAALLSQKVGKPVRVQFMRWDETGWGMTETPYTGRIRAGIDTNGKIVAFDTHVWTHGWASGSPERSQELATQGAGLVQPSVGSSVESRNSGGIYAGPNSNFRLTTHQLPGLNAGMVKGINMRAPMDLSSLLGSEGMIDELAYAANMDPVAFRLQNIAATTIGYQNLIEPTTGWIAVLNKVAEISGWQPKVTNSVKQNGNIVTGRGVAIGSEHTSHTAAVADITVNKTSGKITVNHLYSAMDAGLTINPGLVENQMSGLMIMGTSRALYEQVRFSKSNVTSLDWVSYPILRFKDHPKVTVAVVQFTDQQPTGAGEEAMCPVPAAIANAFFDATGARIRQLPMTPGLVKGTLRAAGVT